MLLTLLYSPWKYLFYIILKKILTFIIFETKYDLLIFFFQNIIFKLWRNWIIVIFFKILNLVYFNNLTYIFFKYFVRVEFNTLLLIKSGTFNHCFNDFFRIILCFRNKFIILLIITSNNDFSSFMVKCARVSSGK